MDLNRSLERTIGTQNPRELIIKRPWIILIVEIALTSIKSNEGGNELREE
jgi:hypothetical protein